jgi:hypothetical protein
MSLYIFSIGGSGVRVLHSLTMLLAAGVKIQSNQVVPVIIDNDIANGNTDTTLKAIKNYRKVRESVKDSSIFATDIAEPKIISISGTQLGTLKDVLGETATGIDSNLKDNIQALYSDKNLDMPLSAGFVGNPNVGSVVLNYLFEIDTEFYSTLQDIQSGDKIFIISSIFGGTGAAGFPLLLNILNSSPNTNWNKSANYKGALSLLPYFNVETTQNNINDAILDGDENGERNYYVKSELFNSKTLAAQLYYDDFVNGQVDAMYYVGDEMMRSTYPNYIGGTNQKNPAHIVEVYGALSIAHFDNIAFNAHTNTQYADLIFRSAEANVINANNTELRKALIRLWMYKRFYLQYLPDNYLTRNPRPTILQNLNYENKDYATNDANSFPKNMKDFLHAYEEWAKELNNSELHERKYSFVDANLSPTDEKIHEGFDELKPNEKTRILGIDRGTVDTDFGTIWNDHYNPTDTNSDVNCRLTKYATQAIEKIINTKMH